MTDRPAEGAPDERDFSWIDRSDALQEAVAACGRGAVAIDTEADAQHRYRDRVCLIQMTADGQDLLIDPLEKLDLTPLAELLADRSRRKILHGADYDLRMLDRDMEMRVEGLFDTMIAARLTGERAFGLATLVEKFFAVKLDKRFQRADWSRRPLPAEMARYAVLDTRYLHALTEILEERLVAQGRVAWAEEEFRRLEAVRWTGDRDPMDLWLRFKNLRSFDSRTLSILRELGAWREQMAMELDQPAFRVAREDVLVALSESAPRAPAALGEIRGLHRRFYSGDAMRRLLGAIESGVARSESDPPSVPRGSRKRLTPEQQTEVRRLSKVRDGIAAELDLEAPVVASRSLIESMVLADEQGTPWSEIGELRRWQRELMEKA